MKKTDKIALLSKITQELKNLYPDAKCSLEYDNDPWKLLIMGMLSAQCTDERVNIVCKELFRIYPNASSLAYAPLEKIEELIKPCGLYHMKSLHAKEASRKLVEEYKGVLPSELSQLVEFPGVGRKVANLLIGDLFHLPAVVTDTHCMRICGRFGMYQKDLRDPYKIEMILRELLEPKESSDFCHRMVLFGREYCMARNPNCVSCPLKQKNLCKGTTNGENSNT